ncbi:retrovirus-related pol polyprotein from transposon TNT 1-94, partial [Tanacetum coccineum]
FLNKTLHAYFKEEGIEHQTSTPRTPKQNGVVERQNRTLVEAARTMLSASKLPLSFWAEHAVATASAQNDNRSLEAESIVRAASTRVRFRLSTTAVLFRCSRSGSLMFNAFFFEIGMECLVHHSI